MIQNKRSTLKYFLRPFSFAEYSQISCPPLYGTILSGAPKDISTLAVVMAVPKAFDLGKSHIFMALFECWRSQ
jgi:hypothetical protein